LLVDPRFRPEYARLYETFGRDFLLGGFQLRIIRRVREAIESTQAELRRANLPALREDAKYLLLVNYVVMIYRPLLRAGRLPWLGPEEFDPEELDNIMRNDVSTIMRESALAVIRNTESIAPEDGVSAHAVVNTLPKIWERLLSGATRLWEGR
jgi:hypothetical protein